jgi:hypothetical protein
MPEIERRSNNGDGDGQELDYDQGMGYVKKIYYPVDGIENPALPLGKMGLPHSLIRIPERERTFQDALLHKGEPWEYLQMHIAKKEIIETRQSSRLHFIHEDHIKTKKSGSNKGCLKHWFHFLSLFSGNWNLPLLVW